MLESEKKLHLPRNFKPVHGNVEYWVQWNGDLREIHYDENELFEALGIIYSSGNRTCLLTLKDKNGNILDQYVLSPKTRKSTNLGLL